MIPPSTLGNTRWIGRCAALLLMSVLVFPPCAPKLRAEGSSAAPALDPGAEPAGYREIVSEALLEFEAHNYEEARSLFARAHALYPSARTHRALGLAEFELRNYGESVLQLEAALRSTVRPLTKELEAETRSVLARANHFVARLYLEAKPTTSKVTLDGVPVEFVPGEPLLLPLGDHVVQLDAPGFSSEKRKLRVQGGEVQKLTLVLRPESDSRTKDDTKKVWYKSPWLWTAVGVVVVGAAVGTGVALSRSHDSPDPYGGTADAVLSGP